MITKIIVLGIYVAILFLIGIIASRRVKSMSDYYLGGKVQKDVRQLQVYNHTRLSAKSF